MTTIGAMDKFNKANTTKSVIDFSAYNALKEKYALIDSYIENGEEIPNHLTKNFVTFPLSDNPEIE
jgi:hypothetical protein